MPMLCVKLFSQLHYPRPSQKHFLTLTSGWLKRLRAVAGVIFCIVQPCQAQVSNSRAVISSGPVAADSPIAASKSYLFAVAPDHRQILERGEHEAKWSSYDTDIDFERVSGLFLRGNELLILDGAAGSLFRTSTLTRKTDLLYHGPLLLDSNQVVALDNHIYVVTSSNTVGDVEIGTGKATPLDVGFELPPGSIRLAGSGNQIILSISEAGVIIGISNPSNPANRTRTDFRCPPEVIQCNQSTARNLSRIAPQSLKTKSTDSLLLSHPVSLAFQDGIIYGVYAVDKQRTLLASSRSRLIPVRLSFSGRPVKTPSEIALTENSIVILDASAGDVVIWPLLVPAEITVNVKTSESLSAVYRYLYARHFLPTRRVQIHGSLEGTLQHEGALLSPYTKDLDEVMCGINKGLCANNSVKNTLLDGTSITIPDLYAEKFIDIQQTTLNGERSLRSEVARGIRSDEFSAWKSPAKVLQLNPQVNQSAISSLVHYVEYKRNGTFTIPVELVRYFAAFPSSDLSNPTSDIGLIQARYKSDLTITSLAAVPAIPQGSKPCDEFPLNRETFNARYKKMLDTIHYQNVATVESSTETIGVAEQFIDCENPDIHDACVYPNGTPPPVRADGSHTLLRSYKIMNDDGHDHGTAVAGLIAARKTDFLGKGLAAPNVLLAPMDPDGFALADTMRDLARDLGGVTIFNLSQKFKDDAYPSKFAANIEDPKIRLANALVVVAAPEEGLPVGVGPLRIPIQFADQPNVIGVAATSVSGSELLQDSGGSAWGTNYVQVAAPGFGFGAPGQNNGYVAVCGTSFAVPLVSATAQLLVRRGVTDPRLIKQRIVATTTMVPAYREKIQGGLLNVCRAISHPFSAVLVKVHHDDCDERRDTVVLLAKPSDPIVLNSLSHGPLTVPLGNILRLTIRQDVDQGTFRVGFRNPVEPEKVVFWDDVSFQESAPWKFKYRVPGVPPGPVKEDCLCNYEDYFGPISKLP